MAFFRLLCALGDVPLTLQSRPAAQPGRSRPGSPEAADQAVYLDTFERLELSHSHIALRTLDGRFVTTRSTPLGLELTLSEALTPDSAFAEVVWPGGFVSLRTAEMTYVGLSARGTVAANRSDTGVAERWLLEEVEVAADVQALLDEVGLPARVLSMPGQSEGPLGSAPTPEQVAAKPA